MDEYEERPAKIGGPPAATAATAAEVLELARRHVLWAIGNLRTLAEHGGRNSGDRLAATLQLIERAELLSSQAVDATRANAGEKAPAKVYFIDAAAAGEHLRKLQSAARAKQ